MATVELPRFSFGKTVTDMFGAIGKNFLLMAGIALLLSGVPSAILFGLFFQSAANSMAVPDSFEGWLLTMWPVFAAGWLVSLFFAILAQNALTSVTLRHLAGGQPSFASAMADGLRAFLSVLGIMAVYFVVLIVLIAAPVLVAFALAGVSAMGGGGAAGVGTAIAIFFLVLLLVVPAMLFVVAIWLVAVPAAIAEHKGPIASLGRSWSLTSGHRWKLVAMILIWFVVLMIVSGALNTMAMPIMTLGGQNPANLLAGMVPALIVQSLLGSLTMVVTHPAIASTYANLRAAKEGVASDQVAEIFE